MFIKKEPYLSWIGMMIMNVYTGGRISSWIVKRIMSNSKAAKLESVIFDQIATIQSEANTNGSVSLFEFKK